MIYYGRILQTGMQSLLAVASGWACGHWQVVEAEPTVQYTNALVLRFCIPCLQIWLLAIKTDMQQADNWRALAAFLLWSVGLQALLALHQVTTRQRLQLDRLGVDGLILTTNNTGILGPVVLQAAVGQQYAPLGMLATVVLYFQQLPLAQLLFQIHHQQQQVQELTHATGPAVAAAAAAAGSPARLSGLVALGPLKLHHGHKFATSPEPIDSGFEDSLHATSMLPQEVNNGGGGSSSQHSHLRHLHHTPAAAAPPDGGYNAHYDTGHHQQHWPPQQQQQQQEQMSMGYVDSSHTELPSAHRSHASNSKMRPCNGYGSAGSLMHQQQGQKHSRGLSWDLEQQHRQGESQPAVNAAEQQPLLQQQQQHGVALEDQSIAAFTLSLLLKNPLVWSTAIAVLLSALGSAALLDPSSPLAIKHLAFVEALLGWFAQTTAPLTLFTTGLWMYSNSQQQQQQQSTTDHPSKHAPASGHCAKSSGGTNGAVSVNLTASAYGSTQVAWGAVAVYLLLRATLAPAFMVVVCVLLGFKGDLAHALVILALLPVAQTAFVVCKQAETGMAAVSLMLVASLFMMLPQLLVVLAMLDRLALFAAPA